MANPYDVHSRSRLYREDALREVQKLRLVEGARAVVRTRPSGSARGRLLPLTGGAKPVGPGNRDSTRHAAFAATWFAGDGEGGEDDNAPLPDHQEVVCR
jgi:hypothetical protein